MKSKKKKQKLIKKNRNKHKDTENKLIVVREEGGEWMSKKCGVG